MIPVPALKFITTLGQNLGQNTGALANELTGGITGSRPASLIEASQATRVEPITLIDSRVEHLPYITDVLQALTSIFTGYYLQAASLSINIGKIDVVKFLDRLNPSRDPWVGVLSTEALLLREDSYQTQLPVMGQPIGLENFGLEASQVGDNAKEIRENTNLSVGKMVEVTIDQGDQKATFPINIRLIASVIDPTVLSHILTDGAKDVSLAERWHLFRANQIEFIRDLILCQDLIDERKKILIRDKGQYAEILKRRRNNAISTFVTGNTSLATASNIVVVSQETINEIQRNQGFKLSSTAVRERIFKDTYLMLMVVIDANHDYVTIYHRSIDTPTELTVRQIKSSAKGSGPDITEILKAYQLGNSPSY
jgi:hypothetical protein